MSTFKFPEDILRDILSRHPAETLIIFKSVCKAWLSLLSDPHFITLHHNRTAADPKSHSIIIRKDHQISFYNTQKATNIAPFQHHLVGNLVGVCNGLVCFRSFGGKDMFLWNPSIRKCKKIQLPVSNTMLKGRVSFSFGFGLDANGYDLVCLRLVCARWGQELAAEVGIYSTLVDSWKTLEGDFRFNVMDYTNCVVVKGAPYWTAIVKKEDGDEADDNNEGFRNVLLAFDARNESFKQLEFPEFASAGGLRTCFVELDGSLGLLVRSSCEELGQCVDVWVLDDEECSWSKKFTVGPILTEMAGFVGCLRNKDILGIDSDGSLFVFDSTSKEIKRVYRDVGNYWYTDIRIYIESLACISGMKGVGKDNQRDAAEVQ